MVYSMNLYQTYHTITQYIVNKLQVHDTFDLVLLQELVTSMAGMDNIAGWYGIVHGTV